jgi:hypothetical protein
MARKMDPDRQHKLIGIASLPQFQVIITLINSVLSPVFRIFCRKPGLRVSILRHISLGQLRTRFRRDDPLPSRPVLAQTVWRKFSVDIFRDFNKLEGNGGDLMFAKQLHMAGRLGIVIFLRRNSQF